MSHKSLKFNQMKKTFLFSIFFAIAIICLANYGFAQQQTQTTKHITREDSAAFNALVMYPDSIRLNIFEVCEYPAVIVNIASLQKNSSSGFSDAISSYSKDEQESFWNLSRYPGLISDLAQGGKKSKEDIDKILVNYPDEIHETALKYGMNYYDALKKIDDLQTQTNTQFDQILSEYPPTTQQAIKVLTQYPEIVSLLNDHLSLSVRIGDHFRRDSVGVIHRMDSLNLAEVRQNAEDAAAWKQNVQQDPQEANDLKSAATEYASSNGYTTEEINTTPSPEYMASYTCQPYSYWFGYPSWYPYSYWYPYPYWYDCGFYYDPYGNMVFIGYPSYYFTNWYFYNPEHMHHYPYLCNSYVNYYYGHGAGHRGMADANTVIVHHWVKDNKPYLPKDFTTNSTNRVEVIKQVGQLNDEVRKEQNGKAVTPAIRDQYLQKNASKFPALNATPQPKTIVDNKQQNVPEVIQQPAKQPAVNIPKSVQKSNVSPKQYSAPKTSNFNTMNNAQQYHRQQWEQTQPSTQQQSQPVQHQQQQQQQAPVQHESKNSSSSGKGK
jgi:hypothetical protein